MKLASTVLTAGLTFLAPPAQAAVLANYDFQVTTGGAATTISAASIVTGSGYGLTTFTGGVGLRGMLDPAGAITATSTTGVTDFTNTRHLVVRVGGTDATSRTDEGGAVTANDYYGFTITPDPGTTLSLSSLSYDFSRSGTFSGRIFVRSSLDGYVNTIHVNDLPNSSNTLGAATPIDLTGSFGNITEAVTFRFYFADDSATRTDVDTNPGIVYRIDNVILQGTIPEPGSTLMLGLGLGALFARRRR